MVRWIVITTVLALLGLPAAAQTPTVITLSCDGTMQQDTADTRELVTKLGLVINLAEQTIVGFLLAAEQFSNFALQDRVDSGAISSCGNVLSAAR